MTSMTAHDPAAYLKPWTGGFFLRWNLGAKLSEYVCQDNNKVEETTAGADGTPHEHDRPVVFG